MSVTACLDRRIATPEVIPTSEQRATAISTFFAVGSYVLDRTIECVKNVEYARELIDGGEYGYGGALVQQEVPVPDPLKDTIVKSFTRERFSYRMTVGSGILGFFIPSGGVAVENPIMVSSTNTKASLGKYRQCSEPGAEEVAIENDSNYIPALILVSDPEKAESVEEIRSELVLPCYKTCIQETFKNSGVFPENTIIIALNPEKTITQIFFANELALLYEMLKRGGDAAEEADRILHESYGSLDFEAAERTFTSLFNDPANENIQVEELAMMALKESADTMPKVDSSTAA